MTLREEVHKLVDELTSQQIVSVRMFLEDIFAGASPRQQKGVPPRRDESGTPAPQQGRISVDEYRRTLGIGTAPKR